MSTPCKGDGGLWLADNAADRHEAMRLCRPCPEIQQCLMGAIERREMFGVWGGKDFSHATTRPQLGPKTPKQEHGTPSGYRAHYRRGEKPCESCIQANGVARARKAAA